MGFLNDFVDSATTTLTNAGKNVLSNVSQVVGGLSAISPNLSQVASLGQLGKTNFGIPTGLVPGASGVDTKPPSKTAKPLKQLEEKWDRPQPNLLFDYSVYNYHLTLSVISQNN